MFLGINGATTLTSDLTADIVSAGKIGFGYLEITYSKLRDYLGANSAGNLLELLERNRIKALSINACEGGLMFNDPGARAAARRQFIEMCAAARDLACPYLVVIPSFLEEGLGLAGEAVIRQTSETLKEYCGIASEYGVKIAFEFLGFSRCSVNNLETCARIVAETAGDNLGIVLDTFHFFIGNSALRFLETMDIEKVFIVHINDCENLPKAELKDSHRLFPGDGIIPLDEIMAVLSGRGYAGVVSVELFRPEYWEWAPEKTMLAAREKAAEVLRRNHCGIQP